MSNYKVCQVLPPVSLGEGPHLDEKTQSLLFVDIFSCDVHRYFPESGRHQVLHIKDYGIGQSVTFVIPLEDDPSHFIISIGRSIAVVEWSTCDPDEKTIQVKAVLNTVDEDRPDNGLKINDGKCDASGRLYTGSVGKQSAPGSADLEMHQGSVFSLDSKLKISKWVDKISLSNGMAWSLDNTTFFYTDSLAYSIDAFDYDQCTGQIGNRRKVLDYKAIGYTKEFADGMCIDALGNLWVANFFGKKVICVDPRVGKIIRTIEMPAEKMTSVCWGGPNYDILYATSAYINLSEDDPLFEYAGPTYAITGLGVKGLKPNNFKCDKQLLKCKFSSHQKQ